MAESIIPILHTTDAEAAAAWYARLHFVKQWEHRFEPGFPLFLCIARGDLQIFLSEHQGDARPDTLVYLRVDNLDAVAAEFGVVVEQQPWGPEIQLTDPAGNRLRLSSTSA
ncbi:glyoxalase superfamily protein [Actinoplanes sp. NPDC051859]|uniref:glyoxalase superfamily protein n=1 Tax=Actinoplanes sp. NPDC051859 TaxID=3363909 RepID=UPI0037AA0954